jgi:hypothetical protein
MKTKYNIETINKQTISQIRQLVEDSLSVILEDNNLRMELGNASYDNDSVKFTGFRISLANALTQEEKALKNELEYRRAFEPRVTLDDSIVGSDRGQQFKLVGFKPRSRKKPFVIEDIKTGGRYVCPESMAERMFKATIQSSATITLKEFKK